MAGQAPILAPLPGGVEGGCISRGNCAHSAVKSAEGSFNGGTFILDCFIQLAGGVKRQYLLPPPPPHPCPFLVNMRGGSRQLWL